MIKAEELPALNYLEKRHPRPRTLTWINRGTDQDLRPTTIQMLLRTLFQEAGSPSVARLQKSAGLRIGFATVQERDLFAHCFAAAHSAMLRKQRGITTAVFDNPGAAERGYKDLVDAGVNPRSISILWRAGQFIQANHPSPPGHSKRSVAAISVGGGLAGAILGATLLSIPGLGLVAAGGAIAAQALGTIGAVGGALGASGAGISRMLTDLDVDDHEVPYFVMQITSGKVFVSVDPDSCERPVEIVRAILMKNAGRFPTGE